jgi:hypothetical protein
MSRISSLPPDLKEYIYDLKEKAEAFDMAVALGHISSRSLPNKLRKAIRKGHVATRKRSSSRRRRR